MLLFCCRGVWHSHLMAVRLVPPSARSDYERRWMLTAQRLWSSMRRRPLWTPCKPLFGVSIVAAAQAWFAPSLLATGRWCSSLFVTNARRRRRRMNTAIHEPSKLSSKAREANIGEPQTILRLSPELSAELLSFVCVGHLAVIDLRAQGVCY